MIDCLLLPSGVRFLYSVRGVEARCEYISRAGGVYWEEHWPQRLHLAVEHHLRGRRRVDLFWTQPQRKGPEPQHHLHPHRGGRVWVVLAGNVRHICEGGIWFVFLSSYEWVLRWNCILINLYLHLVTAQMILNQSNIISPWTNICPFQQQKWT